MIIKDKCTGSFNALSSKICVPKETNDICVDKCNMVTNKNAAEAMKIHISCHRKSKFNSTTCNSNKKWNNKTCQCECKNYHKSKEDYVWNPSICICKNNN